MTRRAQAISLFPDAKEIQVSDSHGVCNGTPVLLQRNMSVILVSSNKIKVKSKSTDAVTYLQMAGQQLHRCR